MTIGQLEHGPRPPTTALRATTIPRTTPFSLSAAEPTPGEGNSVVPSTVWFGPSVPADSERELLAFLGTHHGVAVVHWPRDARLVERLARLGLPRLLLLNSMSDAPAGNGPLQEWALWPADKEKIHSALSALAQRVIDRRAAAALPTVEDRGRVRFGDGCIELPPFEHGFAEALVARFDEPVADDALLAVADDPRISRATLRSRLAWLHKDVNPLGLKVVAVGDDAYAMRRCVTSLRAVVVEAVS